MSAQEGTLHLDQGFFGLTYYKGGQKVKIDDVENTLRKYPKILIKFNEGRSTKNTANFLATFGGFFVGFPIGQSIFKPAGFGIKPPLWWLAGVGAGLAIASIPLNANGKRKMKLAFKEYNGQLGLIEEGSKFDVQIVVKDGLGLRISF